jgi:2-polyprenyl-6-methoxyphenol hydroxylase-like FAD-dependent oxidoreductase
MIETTCCIVGGGPAGMMLGLLLTRAGVDVVVLEKHADFLRDFRGDTIHPSTLELMHELGLLEQFLKLPHQEVTSIGGRFGDKIYRFADFSHLPAICKFIALMPQWDFLDFIAGQARRYPCFQLKMQAEATGLIVEGDRVAGVRATTPEGPLDVRAMLTVACDARHSLLRDKAGLVADDFGAPMDVLWFRLSRRPDDSMATGGVFDKGRLFVMLNRGDYWQCAFVIPKGSAEDVRRRGIEQLRAELALIEPLVADRVAEITDWKQVHLLTVTVNRLRQWHRPGLLCIGDAAHAMSPIGGVGINLAIQDAVAAANLLATPLRRGAVTDADLQSVQERREPPTRKTQAMQVFLQKNVITAVLGSPEQLKPPLLLKMIARFPWLARFPARILGMGFRPEHVDLAVIDEGGRLASK